MEYDNPSSSGESSRIKGREGYFNIDPILRVKKRSPILSPLNERLPGTQGGELTSELANVPLDGLAILTVVSKWMGSLDEWAPHLTEAMQRGYNMLHYTPLQQRGQSLSPYSIADQLAFDNELFGASWKGTREEGVRLVQEKLKDAKDNYGFFSLTDVVLNHTADNSPWLLDHPEAGMSTLLLILPRGVERGFLIYATMTMFIGFSPFNSPHLTPAFEIDSAMIAFSSTLAAKNLPTRVSSAADVDALISAFEAELKALNLWQYYVLDVAREKASINKVIEASETVSSWDGPSVLGKSVVELAEIIRSSGKITGLGSLGTRFGVQVEPKYAASFVKAAFADIHAADGLAEAWGRVVDVINVPLYEEAADDLRVAIDQIKNRLKYTRLDDNGPKLGEISAEYVFVA